MPQSAPLYTLDDLCVIFGVTRKTIHAWRNADPPKIPQPVAGLPVLRWRRDDIDGMVGGAS